MLRGFKDMKQNKKSEQIDSAVDTDATSDANLERIERLIMIPEQSDLATVRVRDGEIEIEISRATTQPIASAPANMTPFEPTVVTGNQADEDMICSPMPARFYRSPAPEEPPFVEVGDTVLSGASIATLEVMKTYNDVEAPFNCEILEILVEDGQAVEYNQPLFRVRQT